MRRWSRTSKRGSGAPDCEFFAPGTPRIFAHRGLALDAPENTLLAFLNALSAGATHIETDVHASADSVAVISHDPGLNRIAGRDVRVDQLTMNELQKIDLGEDQRFASLAEALDAFPEARFNIDVKSQAAAAPTARAIIDAHAGDRVLITAFAERRRRATTALLPGVATSASAGQVARAAFGARLGSVALLRRATRGVDALQVPERYRSFRLVTRRTVRALHSAGIEVHVWTVNEPHDMTRLLDLGVDGIITDRCDVLRALVDARG